MFPSGVKTCEGEQTAVKAVWLLKCSCCCTFSPLRCETEGQGQVSAGHVPATQVFENPGNPQLSLSTP